VRISSRAEQPRRLGVSQPGAEGASLQRFQRGRDSGLPKQAGQLSWSWRDLQGVEAAVPVGHCVNFGERCGSGSFRLSRLPLDLGRCRPDPRGLSMSSVLVGPVDAACAPSPSPSMSTFVIFSSPSERSRLCRNSSRPPKRSEFLLSWDSPAFWPLCRTTSDASTPGSLRSLRSDGATHRTCSALGVSHPLGGLLRIGVAGLLRPAAGYGVRRVSRCPSHPLCGGGHEPSVPRAAVTLRRVPLVSSRSASLRSLPPCRFRPSSRSHPPGCPGLRSTSRTSSLASFASRSRLAPFPRRPLVFRGRRAGMDPRRPKPSGFPEVAR
jgi:hypothetical protein